MKPAVLVILVLLVPASSRAGEHADRLCGIWGLDAWGLTYHVSHTIDYNDTNWGTGLRCYARPRWWLFGKSEDNKAFLEVDGLLNSYKGLVLPVSAGVEYKLVNLPERCDLRFLGALTVAYYGNPVKKESETKWGPVPGFAVGCGRIRSNVTLIPSNSSQLLAAVVASMTIIFK